MYSVKIENSTAVYTDLEENRRAQLPAENLMGIYTAKNPKAMSQEEVSKAVLSPVAGGERLRDIVKRKNAVTACVIVSDATRGVPTAKVAPYVLDELEGGGIKRENIVFIVALGVHRDATEDEMREFLGDELYGTVRIENHAPFDESRLVYIGETSAKTPVRVNKTVWESDIKVTIGKVELHDMAGFSGGRKSTGYRGNDGWQKSSDVRFKRIYGTDI